MEMQAPECEAWQEIAFLKEICKPVVKSSAGGKLSALSCPWSGQLGVWAFTALCVFAKGGFLLGSLEGA